MHVHAFSPLEVLHGATTLGCSVEEFLSELKAAGLATLPGTAAEILDDEVRALICPDKLDSAQWLEVVRTAHTVGLKSTATIMFGHVDGPMHWARYLARIRALQAETRGFTEFVPLPFVHMEAPMWRAGRARRTCALGADFSRSRADARGRAAGVAPGNSQYPDLLGQNGRVRSGAVPRGRRERPGRNADE